MPVSSRTTLLSPELHSNFFHLYADIAWFGILSGSTLSFVSIYAARLGATGVQVGLLSAGPAVVNMLFSLPMGRWLENRPLVQVNVFGALWSRAGYLLLLLMPVLFGNSLQIWAMVLLGLALSIPGTALNIGFNAMFAGVVPPEWRATVIGRRNALSAVSSMLALLACGLILDRIPWPYNYQIVFGIGWIGGMASVYHLTRIRHGGQAGEPGFLPRWPARLWFDKALHRLAQPGKALLRLDVLRGPFGPFMAAYLLFYTFQYVPIPLLPIYNVNELGLTDGEIGVGTAVFQFMVTGGSLVLGRLNRRFNHRQLLIASTLAFGQYPLLLYFARDATLYYLASVIGGVIFAIINVGLLNRLMECVPDGDRPAHMALHNLVFNLGILAGSLIGPLLGDLIGLREALLVSAGLRVVAGVAMIFWV
jgi:MFS family permease